MPTTVDTPAAGVGRFIDAFLVNDGQALNGTNDRLHGIRHEAIARFEALGFPAPRAEAWKYTNIRRVLERRDYALRLAPSTDAVTAADVDDALIPDLDAHVVVLVNGRFRADLSRIGDLPAGVVLTGFQRASAEHADLVNRHFAQYADYEEEVFTALNTAFTQDGLFLYVPKNTSVGRAIQVVNLIHTDADLFVQPRKLMVAETGAQAKVVETFHSLTDTHTFTNFVTEAFVGANAHLRHYQVQAEGPKATTVGHVKSYQEGDSTFTTTTVTLSGATIRNNVSLHPDATNCETNYFGLFLADGAMHVDNHTFMDHAKPQCLSNELYKGILDDKAVGVFNGKIFVRQDAQQINAYQSNKSILLSESAKMYSKPELEIYADDVQCSHGATTGQLDPEGIFYLRTRGLTERKARALMLRAFARDVLDTIEVDALREHLDGILAERF